MMGRGRDMNAEQRRTLISMRNAGVAVNRVALQMNIMQPKDCFQGLAEVHGEWQSCWVWRRFMENGSRAEKVIFWEDRMLKRVVQQHRVQSLKAINRMWNERISNVISLSTSRRRIRRQSLYNRVARRKPLIGANNRYAIKCDGTKPLVGMCM